MYEKLLEGAYDLHVHTGPDVSERKLDDLEYAERLTKLGMKGFGIKSHYSSSAGRAKLVNKLYPDTNALGAIVLNNTIGGLNPVAVEMAVKEGVKLVWMPTFDAENEIRYLSNSVGYEELPPWAQVQLERKKDGKEQTTITVTKDGKLKDEVHEILRLVKQADQILATGHLSKPEIYEIAKAAKEIDFNKLVITHPTFSSIALSKQEQQELAELGAYLEVCCGTITPKYGATWDDVVDQIRYIGEAHFLLSSDMGQTNNPYPDEGLLEGIMNLAEAGISEEAIRRMTVENPTLLAEG